MIITGLIILFILMIMYRFLQLSSITSITEKNVRSIRPGFGLHPKYYNEIIGKIANKSLEVGDRFDLNHIA